MGPISVLSAGIRLVLRLPVALIKGVSSSVDSSTASDTRPKGIGKVIGWPPPRVDPSRETAWLDGLRGLAAFLVLAYHFNTAFLGFYLEAPYGSTLLLEEKQVYDLWRLPLIRFFITSGHAQVSVFFVLSGLVLSWSSFDLIRRGQSERILNTISSAVVRRWFRLYLPCFGAGLVAFMRFWLIQAVPPGTELYSNIFRQLWDYVVACESFARPLLRDRKYPNWLLRYSWVVWTIPLEFEGSMLVFLSLLAMARVKEYVKRFLILSTISIYACYLGFWTYWLFATGMLVADYVRESGGFRQLVQQTTVTSRLFWWLIFILGMLMAAIPNPNEKFYDRNGYEFLDNWAPENYRELEGFARFWWSWAGIFILFSSCHLKRIQIICESSLARYLGRISFMLYVTHDDVPKEMGNAFGGWYSRGIGTKVYNETFKKYLYEMPWIPGAMLFCLQWIVALTLAILLAHWCEVLIDRPSVAFAKWIEMKLIGDEGKIPVERQNSNTRGAESEDAIMLPVYRNTSE